MLTFLLWYLLSTLIGWLTFPLLYRLLPSLPGRGYGLARPAGLLLWGYLFWIGASLGLLQNDVGGAVLALILLAGLSAWALFSGRKDDGARSWPEQARRSLGEILSWAQVQRRVLWTSEALFLFAFAFLALLRAANPDLVGTEKPMELAFINAILRAPSFPPPDPWLSGYAISYYYFGYILTALLARLSGVWGSVAHNLMTALTFALAAQSSHAILFDLLSLHYNGQKKSLHRLALLAPLFLLLLSNWEGLLEVLHRTGLFWSEAPSAFNFWRWLDLRDLNQPPAQPLGWLPQRYWWWWRASRVVQDYTLQGAPQEIIDEFPFFSFLLGDLHPHVLNIPYTLLGIGLALGLYLQKEAQEHFPWLSWRLFFLLSLLLGGLAFLNTWDVLIIALLLSAAFVLHRLRFHSGIWQALEESLLLFAALVLSAVLLYLPFLVGFSSQARGILPNLVNPTRGAHLWVMFGSLFVPLFAYLWSQRPFWQKERSTWKIALGGSVLLFLLFFLLSWGMALLLAYLVPSAAATFLSLQGVPSWGEIFRTALERRLIYGFGDLSLFALFSLATAHFWKHLRPLSEQPSSLAAGFFALLSGIGVLWIALPDFFYLGDQFGWRMNTVFKFYYQAWIFLSLTAAYATVLFLGEQHSRRALLALVILALLAGLIYPVLGWWDRTGGLTSLPALTLDDFRRLERLRPAEAAAIRYLQRAPFGTLAEAVGGSYTDYGRIATYTGLPAVLNWPGHESQWRGSAAPQGTRQEDIRRLYETDSWEEAQRILQQYGIRYIYVGDLEYLTYRVQLEKFERHLFPVFRQNGVIIYAVY